MRKTICLAIAVAFVFALAAPVFAMDIKTSVDKATEGLIEVVKSPLVIIDHTKKTYDDGDNKLFGLGKGLVESPFHMVDEAVHGLIKFVTFPID